MQPQDLAFTAGAGERSRWYIGGLVTFLVTAKDTNGSFSLSEHLMRRGLEPPRHMHTKEDETMYVLDGEVIYFVGDRELAAKAGESIYLPRNVPHHFSIQSETARFLIMMTPGGLEEMFMSVGIPAERLELPPPSSGPPPAAVLEKLATFQKKFGIEIQEVPKGL